MEMAKVYTMKDTAELLKTDTQTILNEIETGRLEAFKVGHEWRTTDKSIIEFISKGGSQPAEARLSKQSFSDIVLQSAATFRYTWPGGQTEEYPEAYEGTVDEGEMHYEVKIGIGERESAGKNRKRVTVFLNGRPTVEFAGSDAFEESGLVTSVVTLPNKKRLKPGQPIPDEYKSFDLRRYNSIIQGPRASTAMAVVVKIDALETMVAHAVIRATYRDQI